MNPHPITSKQSHYGRLPLFFCIALVIFVASGSCRQPQKSPLETILIAPQIQGTKEDNLKYSEPEALYYFSNGMIIRIDTGWYMKQEWP